MRKLLIIFCVWSGLTAAVVAAAVGDFPLMRTATATHKTDGEFVGIEFDAAMYAQLNDVYGNLWLLDTENRVVPFAVKTPWAYRTEKSMIWHAGKITALMQDPQKNTATLVYELNTEGRNLDHVGTDLTRLIIKTRSVNFNKTVSITAVAADGTPTEIVTAAPFFNHAKLLDLANSEFNFAPITTQKLLITIHNFAEQSNNDTVVERVGDSSFTEQTLSTAYLQIAGIEVFSTPTVSVPDKVLTCEFDFSPLTTEAAMKIFNQEFNAAYKKSHPRSAPSALTLPPAATLLMFNGSNVPLTNLWLKATTPQYQRRLQIYVLTAAGLLRAHETSINHFGEATEINLVKMFGQGTRYAYLALVIHNGDDLPLTAITSRWFAEKRLAILAANRAPERLTVYYGGEVASPQYDLRQRLENRQLTLPPLYHLSPPQINPLYTASPSTASATGKSALLYVILIVVGGLLAVLIVKSLRTLDATPPDEVHENK